MHAMMMIKYKTKTTTEITNKSNCSVVGCSSLRLKYMPSVFSVILLWQQLLMLGVMDQNGILFEVTTDNNYVGSSNPAYCNFHKMCLESNITTILQSPSIISSTEPFASPLSVSSFINDVHDVSNADPDLLVRLGEDDHRLETQNISNKFDDTRRQLRNTTLRYYIYTDLVMTQHEIIRNLLKEPRDKGRKKRRLIGDGIIEYEILEMLHYHPLRTFDIDTADIFIAPISIGLQMIVSPRYKKNKMFRSALDALESHVNFKKWMGHRHVIISLTQPAFDVCNVKKVRDYKVNRHVYQRFANVTIAREMDSVRIAHYWRNKTRMLPHTTHAIDDYAPMLSCKIPSTHSAFSLGLLVTTEELPMIDATYEKFQKSSNFLFYQTRPDPSIHNSTIYRHAPLLQRINETLPQSSIGYGILDPKEWIRQYTDSKFCLVVRGDTPHSHALMRSIKVGCIPVIVSDLYPIYAPTLPLTLRRMHDYAIFIPESTFLEDPARALMTTLMKEEVLSEQDIRDKLEAIRFVQQVAFVDHPKSLFVEAFLKEADSAMKMSHPKLCGF